MNKIKRERCPNWDNEEKEIFFHCLKKLKSTIEDPRKDCNTNLKKTKLGNILQMILILMQKFKR